MLQRSRSFVKSVCLVQQVKYDILTTTGFVTPDCIRTLYGTIDYTPHATDKNSIALTNYLNETSYREDIKKFLKEFRPEAASVADTFPITVVAGADNDQSPESKKQFANGKNIEGDLDSQQILSIAWPTPFEAINTGHFGPKNVEPYLTFLNYILARDNVPNVISTSYGEDEQDVPASYARRVCNGFAQLGARGVSVLFSSGDFGVGGGKCVSNDGTKTRRFLPHFPASCPWVTSVGATQNFNPEIAVTQYASGGGFSNYFNAPKYQKETVSAYVAGLDGLYEGLFNRDGRSGASKSRRNDLCADPFE